MLTMPPVSPELRRSKRDRKKIRTQLPPGDVKGKMPVLDQTGDKASADGPVLCSTELGWPGSRGGSRLRCKVEDWVVWCWELGCATSSGISFAHSRPPPSTTRSCRQPHRYRYLVSPTYAFSRAVEDGLWPFLCLWMGNGRHVSQAHGEEQHEQEATRIATRPVQSKGTRAKWFLSHNAIRLVPQPHLATPGRVGHSGRAVNVDVGS